MNRLILILLLLSVLFIPKPALASGDCVTLCLKFEVKYQCDNPNLLPENHNNLTIRIALQGSPTYNEYLLSYISGNNNILIYDRLISFLPNDVTYLARYYEDNQPFTDWFTVRTPASVSILRIDNCEAPVFTDYLFIPLIYQP